MAVPKNKKLYAKVKKLANEKFATPTSIYKSSWIVKKYKSLGGEYDTKTKPGKGPLTGLARWFKEEWVDLKRPIPAKKSTVKKTKSEKTKSEKTKTKKTKSKKTKLVKPLKKTKSKKTKSKKTKLVKPLKKTKTKKTKPAKPLKKYMPCGRPSAKSNTPYPLCRPSIRITKKTPRTYQEISKKSLAKAKQQKKNKKRIMFGK